MSLKKYKFQGRSVEVTVNTKEERLLSGFCPRIRPLYTLVRENFSMRKINKNHPCVDGTFHSEDESSNGRLVQGKSRPREV